MGALEKALRLLIDLHALMATGKGESPEADAIREQIDEPFGWCAPKPGVRELDEEEKRLFGQVSAALTKDRP